LRSSLCRGAVELTSGRDAKGRLDQVVCAFGMREPR
jgi:hypothetical protein